MDDTDKQRMVVWMVVGGVLCLPAGGLLILFGGPVGDVVGLLLLPAGLVLIIIGIAIMGIAGGWGSAFGDPRKKPIQQASGVYIIAKVIVDDQAQPVLEPSVYNPDELKYLIQIRFANGRTVEFETSPEVFDEVGEGMYGDIVHQGKWLSRFQFRPKPGRHEIGEDPFASGKL